MRVLLNVERRIFQEKLKRHHLERALSVCLNQFPWGSAAPSPEQISCWSFQLDRERGLLRGKLSASVRWGSVKEDSLNGCRIKEKAPPPAHPLSPPCTQPTVEQTGTFCMHAIGRIDCLPVDLFAELHSAVCELRMWKTNRGDPCTDFENNRGWHWFLRLRNKCCVFKHSYSSSVLGVADVA